MSVFNLDSGKNSQSIGSSNTKMGGLRIRNKAIPIINPLVKNPNWPSTIAPHKKGKHDSSWQIFNFPWQISRQVKNYSMVL